MNKYIDLWKSWGINSLEDYYRIMPILLKEHGAKYFDELFPENDWVEIWRQADEHFGIDPVINRLNFNLNSGNIQKGNQNNHSIALLNGLPSFVDFALDKWDNIAKIAEIGTGYGSFYYEYFQKKKGNILYYGFDILDRNNGLIPLELIGEDGNFTDEQLYVYQNYFEIVYCCNVTQHLSRRQNVNYLQDISTILKSGGFYIANYSIHNDPKQYFYHYGMITESFEPKELLELFSKYSLRVVAESFTRTLWGRNWGVLLLRE